MRAIKSFVRWFHHLIAALQKAREAADRNALMRLLIALMIWKFAGDFADVGSLALWAPDSQAAAAASLLGREFFGVTMIFLALMLLPFMVSEMCWWLRERRRSLALLAMAASGIAGALLLLLVVMSRNTDLLVVRITLAHLGIEGLLLMLLLGAVLNRQVLEEHGLSDFHSESNRVPLDK